MKTPVVIISDAQGKPTKIRFDDSVLPVEAATHIRIDNQIGLTVFLKEGRAHTTAKVDDIILPIHTLTHGMFEDQPVLILGINNVDITFERET